MASLTAENESTENTSDFDDAGRFELLKSASKGHTDNFVKFIGNPELFRRNLKPIAEKERQFLERVSESFRNQMKSHFRDEIEEFLSENMLPEKLEILDKLEENQSRDKDYHAWRPIGKVDEMVKEMKCQILEDKMAELKNDLDSIKSDNDKSRRKIHKNHEDIINHQFHVNNGLVSDIVFINQ